MGYKDGIGCNIIYESNLRHFHLSWYHEMLFLCCPTSEPRRKGNPSSLLKAIGNNGIVIAVAFATILLAVG